MHLQGRLGRLLLLAGLSALCGAAFLSPLNLVERFFLDARFVIISELTTDPSVSDRVVIVLMDERSEGILGVPAGSKWREFFPRVVDTLKSSGTRATVFDLEFLSEEPQWDLTFARALEAAGNVIAGEREPGTTTGSLSDSFAGMGSLRVEATAGVPRRVVFDGEQMPLSFLAAGSTIPADGFWISFTRSVAYFPSFSFADLYAADEERLADALRTPLSIFRDKVVLIGMDLPSVDRHVFPNTIGAKIPGVYGQAYAIETLLSEKFLHALPLPLNAAALGAFILLFCFLLMCQKKMVRRVLTPLLPALMFVVCILLFSQYAIWLVFAPLFVSSIAAVLLHWLLDRRALRTGLKSAIGFDPELVGAFRRRASAGIVQEPVAILCSDIRDYTEFVSSSDPATASSVLNEYLQAMETVISTNGGYVNKYVGDEIVAVFGFPLGDRGQAYRAARSGLAMLEVFGELTSAWRLRGVHHFRKIGIGIDYGEVTFTEVGGRARRQLDIIGDAINGASRIEALTKKIGYAFAVSDEAIRALIGGSEERELKDGFNPLGAFALRGQGERLIYAHHAARKNNEEKS